MYVFLGYGLVSHLLGLTGFLGGLLFLLSVIRLGSTPSTLVCNGHGRTLMRTALLLTEGFFFTPRQW